MKPVNSLIVLENYLDGKPMTGLCNLSGVKTSSIWSVMNGLSTLSLKNAYKIDVAMGHGDDVPLLTATLNDWMLNGGLNFVAVLNVK